MKHRLILVFVLSLILSITVSGQSKKDYRKLHYLSEEEMSMPLNTQRDFVPTDPPAGIIRNVAEFDQMQGVLIRYPFGIPMELIREMADYTTVVTIVASGSQQQAVTTQYQNNNVNIENCEFLIAQTDSYWVRDYGPWYVFDGDNQPGIVDFPYNRPRPNDNNIPAAMADYLDIDLYGMNLISTGGNYMCSGMGIAASTDLVWEENPTLTHDEVAAYVNDYLGNSVYEVTMDPLGDYIKHIDCWGKFLSPGKVIIGQVPETDNRYEDFEYIADYFASQTSSYGKPWDVYRVFTPGTAPNTPYSNALILNQKVFVPQTGSQWDDEALVSWQEAMPGYEIIGIYSNNWENTDALHCRTKGIADLGMLYIDHMPTIGTVPYHPDYEISADITACSGATIYSDSVLIYYKINAGDFAVANMTNISGNTYSGTISDVMPGDTVSYYIYAADNSGRQSKQPYIGQADPFVFKNFYFPYTELDFNPDSVLFLDYEQMEVGIHLDIINLTENRATINSLTEFGEVFAWYVDSMPELPYELYGFDTLKLLVKCDIPVDFLGDIIVDTMFVETNLGMYKERIMIDSDLLSVNITKAFNPVTVYPNPAKDMVNFSIDTESANIKIFDINGQVIMSNNFASADGVITINLQSVSKTGTYFYRVTTDQGIYNGKFIIIE